MHLTPSDEQQIGDIRADITNSSETLTETERMPCPFSISSFSDSVRLLFTSSITALVWTAVRNGYTFVTFRCSLLGTRQTGHGHNPRIPRMRAITHL